ASPERIWDAVRDVGAVHERLAPGFVVDTRLQPGARVVTFANGLVARELIVDVDDEARRLAWAVVGSPRLTHHNASLQVFDDGDGQGGGPELRPDQSHRVDARPPRVAGAALLAGAGAGHDGRAGG